ncbi:unnamed protein product [Trichobilharzia regenti]|nr:unnamed protein product [Trichobilharzia regenti]
MDLSCDKEKIDLSAVIINNEISTSPERVNNLWPPNSAPPASSHKYRSHNQSKHRKTSAPLTTYASVYSTVQYNKSAMPADHKSARRQSAKNNNTANLCKTSLPDYALVANMHTKESVPMPTTDQNNSVDMMPKPKKNPVSA